MTVILKIFVKIFLTMQEKTLKSHEKGFMKGIIYHLAPFPICSAGPLYGTKLPNRALRHFSYEQF